MAMSVMAVITRSIQNNYLRAPPLCPRFELYSFRQLIDQIDQYIHIRALLAVAPVYDMRCLLLDVQQFYGSVGVLLVLR